MPAKFKVGDVVVFVDSTRYNGPIIEFDANDEELQYRVKYSAKYKDSEWCSEEELELLSVFESPLYQELK